MQSSSSGGGGLSSSINSNISTLLGKQPHLNSSSPLAKPMYQPLPKAYALPPIITTTPRSHYTGGILRYPHPPTHDGKDPEFTYVYVAFESPPVSSPDIYALATLQILLGGGGSFSAGGPGKGITRLYTNVLNQYGWVESCVGFSNSYSDSGVFGIGAAVRTDATHAIVDVICRELALLAYDGRQGITKIEADRAKKQLKSSLLMNLESRIVEMDDLGKQVALQGFKTPIKEMCDRIDALTIADLRGLAERIIRGR